jgi:predicted nicotinamide N-methyase
MSQKQNNGKGVKPMTTFNVYVNNNDGVGMVKACSTNFKRRVSTKLVELVERLEKKGLRVLVVKRRG